MKKVKKVTKNVVKNLITTKRQGGFLDDSSLDFGKAFIGLAFCVALLAFATDFLDVVGESLMEQAMGVLGK